MNKKIVVIHSGGMDSSLCLRLMMQEFDSKDILSLSFVYGQRHEASELNAARKICLDWQIDHVEIPISFLRQITESALLNKEEKISQQDTGIPNTMVLGRNGLMARLGAIYGYGVGANKICMGIIGVEAANSGYRDCTRGYMDLMQEVLRLDLDDPSFSIITPIVDLTKKQTLQIAQKLGVLEYLLEETVTCYEGIAKQGCGVCPACMLRNEGIEEYRREIGPIHISY